ncbi:hypothetical protein SPFL3102_03593 [Sporomusaceae bacterium FL31]|nr:hypothetical protein SPFL3101_00412 [Sporomusaceae bacterium FL31]GCE35742.1 hypothetical protein SPFL3102_03593 [Sporomusaceae bacterium]
MWSSLSHSPKSTPKSTTAPALMQSETTVTVVPKESPQDNDVELTQTYKASINGVEVIAPIKTTGSSKGIIKQEIDLKPVVDLAKEQGYKEAEKVFKKSWEISGGLGVHKGDLYIPIEIQRDYKPNRTVSAEVHVDSSGISGGEVKTGWKF